MECFFAKNMKNTTWTIILIGWRNVTELCVKTKTSCLLFCSSLWNCSEPVRPLIMRLITTSWCIVQAKVISRKIHLFITLKWSPPQHSLVKFGSQRGFSNQTSCSWCWVVISTSAFQTTGPCVCFKNLCPLCIFLRWIFLCLFLTPPPSQPLLLAPSTSDLVTSLTLVIYP